MQHIDNIASAVLRRLPPSLRHAAKSCALRIFPASVRRSALQRHFAGSAQFFERSGSRIYCDLSERLSEELKSTGDVSDCLVSSWASNHFGEDYPLRLFRHVHEQVLTGRASRLARLYPSAGGLWEPDAGAQEFFAAVLQWRRELCRELLPVQTNEVQRCRILLLGFLFIHRLTGLRLELMELGASAGLLLNWDKYCYTVDGGTWGDASASVRLEASHVGDLCDVDCQGLVVAKSGCDLRPLDPGDAATTLELRANVWPDQLDRLTMLEAALDIARKHEVPLDASDCVAWIRNKAHSPSDGVVRVVFHSHIYTYLSPSARQQLGAAIGKMAMPGASQSNPLAWLRLESYGHGSELRLTLWPGPKDYVLARADTHAMDFQRLV